MDIENVKGRCFYIEEEGVPPYDELIYVANPAKMDKDKMVRFLKATELATQFIINNPQKSWEIFSATSPELQDELNNRAWYDTLPRFALRPATLDVILNLSLFFMTQVWLTQKIMFQILRLM